MRKRIGEGGRSGKRKCGKNEILFKDRSQEKNFGIKQ